MADVSTVTDPDAEVFDALDQALRTSGPGAAIDRLIGHLIARGDSRALLDALLLKARQELGLPPIQVGSLADVGEPVRTQFEERYIEAIRSVGGRLLAAGEVAAAWPYFRAIGEPGPVAEAIDAYEPEEDDDRVGQLIEVAFNHGANPRKGYELILKHYGTCSAITAFEQLPPDESTRVACADALVRQLHEQLVANLRSELAQKEAALPAEGAPIADLIAGQDWLFADEAYHLDVSHLAATVRVATMLTDPGTIAMAVGLTDYGRNLSERHRYEGDSPFEDTYRDHGVYLRALVGRDVDAAVAHFRSKIPLPDPDHRTAPIEAQVLVVLLLRLGRLDEAIDVSAEHLAGVPESALICPGIAQLCQRAGRPDRLAEIARKHGDLVNYAAAILQARPV